MNISLYKLEELKKVVKIEQSDNPIGLTVVYDASAEAKETQLFLEKIFSAVSVSIDSVHKLTVNNALPAPLVNWPEWPNCQKVLFFGINPRQLGIHYELQAFKPKRISGKTFLYAQDLNSIQKDPTLKKALWVALQQIFDINV